MGGCAKCHTDKCCLCKELEEYHIKIETLKDEIARLMEALGKISKLKAQVGRPYITSGCAVTIATKALKGGSDENRD